MARPRWPKQLFLVLLTPVATGGLICFGAIAGMHHVAMLRWSLQARGEAARFHSRGVLLAAASHFSWLPLFAAASAGLPQTPLGLTAAAACASFVHASILAPFALHVPAHLTLPKTKPGVAFPMPDLDRALAQWDRLPWRRRIGLLLFRIVPVVAAFATYFVAELWMSSSESFVAASLVFGAGVFAYAEAAASAHVDTRRPDETPSAAVHYLYLHGLGSALLGCVLLGYGFVAATEPTSMAMYEGDLVGGRPVVLRDGHAIEEGEVLPGTDIRLRLAPGVISVETADGGGAGEVAYLSPHERRPNHLASEGYVVETDSGFEIFHARGEWRSFRIDTAGVRADDGLSRRVMQGLGRPALLFLAAGLCLAALCVWLLVAAGRVRRRLHAIKDVKELESPDCAGALEGTFHDSEGKGEGEVRAHLGGRMIRFRLPSGDVEVLGLDAASGSPRRELKDGDSVTLTGVFSTLQASARELTLPWPEEALLLAGDKSKVAEGLLRKAIRPALLCLFLTNVAWIAAVVCVVAHRL